MVSCAVGLSLLAGLVVEANAAPVVVKRVTIGAPVFATVAGPGGGVVTVTGLTASPTPIYATSAFRPNGARLWRRVRPPGCGNCDDGPQPIVRQPDGTVGPIGPIGDDFWAYTPSGEEVAGCSGALSPAGVCVWGGSDYAGGGPPSGLPYATATIDGARLWRTNLPGTRWLDEFNVAPYVVRDAGGMAYIALAGPTDTATGTRLSGRLFALAALDGTVAWQADGPRMVLAGLDLGVLTRDEAAITAYQPTGTVRWSRAVAANLQVFPSDVRVDRPRRRVVVDGMTSAPGVAVLNADTGVTVWRTPPRDRARLLHAQPGGRVYVAADAGPRRGVLALNARGRLIWRLPLTTRAMGLTQMSGGRVAITVSPQGAGTSRLLIVRPGV
jgi:outer membrane protein assembly factor BamB